MSPEDAALVARLLDGDERAFASLVEALHPSMIRLASVFVGANRAVAEEVAQETWTAVLAGLRDFEGRSSLKSWIYSILTNRAKTRGVREGRYVPLAEDASNEEPSVHPSRFTASGKWGTPPRSWHDETPEKLMARGETMQAISRAIAELPPPQRTVIELRDVQGAEAAEVCEILKITENHQRVLLHRARSKVRAALEEHFAGRG